MSERAIQLHATADGQISELIGLLSAAGDSVLARPCPGRERMGDGTVAACATHTAERYRVIAGFLGAAGGPIGPSEGDHAHGPHDGDHTTGAVDLDGLLDRLAAARDAFGGLAELSDEQLDVVPAAGLFRFCDGQRTLQQVVVGLLRHQGHQIDAVRSAVG